MKTKYLLLPLFLLTSCVLFQPKKTMNKYADGIDDIASEALDGIFRGLEDNQADSVVAQLTGAIVDAAINSSQKINLDSVKIKLADVIRTAVRDGVLDSANQGKFRLQVGLLLKIVDQKLQSLIANTGDNLKRNAVDNLKAIKEELFKEDSKRLINDLMKEVFAGIKEGYSANLKPELFEALDTLENKAQRFFQTLNGAVSKWEDRAYVLLIGIGLLIVGILILWYWLRKKAVQNREALMCALKAVDEIPSKTIYDSTKKLIHQNASQPISRTITDTVKRFEGEFGKKMDYRRNEITGFRLLIKYLEPQKNADLRQQIIDEAIKINPELGEFIEEEFNKPIEL